MNFLITCKVWLENTKPESVLNFFSFDKYLFRLEDFQKIISINSELNEYCQELEAFYPKNINGVQRIPLFSGRVILNLIIGDIIETRDYLKSLSSIDAWYLDGFSPPKNPELWSEELLREVHSSCHSNTTFSTYTSSGLVKNNLTRAGFSFSKVDGFSNKRHMLVGDAKTDTKRNETIRGKVAVIGSGIAGCSLSYALAKRGLKVDLFEKYESICSGASDHELLVTYPKLSAHDTPYGRFNLQSFVYATRFYDQLNSEGWNKTGVMVLNHDADSNKKNKSLLEKRSDGLIFKNLNEKEVSSKAGIELNYQGLLYEDAGYIFPKEICKALINSPNINLFTSAKIENLKIDEGLASFKIDKEIHEYEYICLCTGSDTDSLIHLDGFSKKRGQVSHIESNEILNNIKLPICAKGYLSPKKGDIHIVGSSYSNLEHLKLNEEEHLDNLEKLKIITKQPTSVNSGKAGFRAVAKDHMPIVGQINGVFLNTCHGSRASVSAPISAEIIASLITGTAPPLEKRELKALSPLRFN